MKLTAIDVFGCLLLLGAGAVLSICLGGKTSLGAGSVEVATVVHGLLERVALPAEDVVTVGGGSTVALVSIALIVIARRVGIIQNSRTRGSWSTRKAWSYR